MRIDSTFGAPKKQTHSHNAFERFTRCAMFAAVGFVGAGATAFYAFHAQRVTAALCGLGFLLMIVAFGVKSAALEPAEDKEITANLSGDARVEDLNLNLRHTHFPWLPVFLAALLTVAALVAAWRSQTLWPLVGLIFPTVLLITVVFARFAWKYELAKELLKSRASQVKRR